MELNEKIQQLRKEKNLTQEELAGLLFVSRTAVSKWESGRGYPSIDSLKAISKLFSVSIDSLLSGEQLISLAQAEKEEKAKSFRATIFGALDCMTVLLFFLPLFAQNENGVIVSVPLISIGGAHDFIWIIYVVLILATVIFGVAQLALQKCENPVWVKIKLPVSLVISMAAILFAIANRQPYTGAFLLSLLAIKVFLLLKR